MTEDVNLRGLAGPVVGPAAEWSVAAANPRDAEAALHWQVDRIGSRAWRAWSLKFQRLAFGYAHDTGWPDEACARHWFESHGLLYDGAPPRGALVWYRAGDDVVVCCSLGGGRTVGPLPDGPVGIAGLVALGSPYRWSAPVFPFAH